MPKAFMTWNKKEKRSVSISAAHCFTMYEGDPSQPFSQVL